LLAPATILFFLAQVTPTEKEEKNKHQINDNEEVSGD
jgi:hypothetical protein